MLTLDSISCIRGGLVLFTKLGLTIGDHSIVHVKGPNGAGKSSLLTIMAGLLPPTSGRLLYAQEPIAKHMQEYHDIVQYMPHQLGLKAAQTVKQNIQFYAALNNTSELVDAALSYFELTELKDTQVATLSAGWQKRVALAKLIACHSEMWLLDEPYVHLDTRGKELLNELINIRVREGASIVITSHEPLPFENIIEIDLASYAYNQPSLGDL